MAQQKPGTIKKNSESGLCQGKQWPHQQQRLCNCCSATFHSTELRQKCTPRILHSPEELKHVLFGTKMIALFLGANGVLQILQNKWNCCNPGGCDTKRGLPCCIPGLTVVTPFCRMLVSNDFQLVSSFYRMYPNLNWQQTGCFICRFSFCINMKNLNCKTSQTNKIV